MKNILFVCIENACRSQMAEAFANMHGHEVLKACSAGSQPSGAVSDKAVRAMREIGYDLSTHTSKSVDEIPDMEYDIVITMGCGDACPSVRAKQRREWSIPDPRDMDMEEFNAVRDEIERQVLFLVAELKQ
ncbi:MAG: arsenate reductase ArsC [Gammaproteobacteria bacterium]|jgi:arsenate reductase